MLGLHLTYECLYRDIERSNTMKNTTNTMSNAIQIHDEEVEDKINEYAARGDLVSRAMMKVDRVKDSRSFDVGAKIIRTGTHLS